MATKTKTSKNLTKPVTAQPQAMTPENKARGAVLPSINGAIVIDSYQGNILGKDADLGTIVDRLRDTFEEVKGGDLSNLEAMLISQATALQTIFTSLARRAANQEHMMQYQTFLGLALKAQAQSRATISALVDLKYPRQATFVKQANIAHGPQQVNNASTPASAQSRTEEIKPLQNELLEDQRHGSTQLDTRATPTPARSDTTMEAVAAVHGAAKRKG